MAPAKKHIQQQAVLAEFGQLALRSDDLNHVLDSACMLVSRCLGVPIAKVLEARPGGTNLLLRAAVGLPADIAVPGKTEIPGGRMSAAGYALATGEPVISDISTETRFEISELVRRAGVRTTANVLVASGADPFGVLEVDTRDVRSFAADEIAFLKNYANLIAAAVDRCSAAGRIARLASERELLMRELQHRTKNDLQIITSLLSLALGQTSSSETRVHLESVSSRIDTLRLLHERMSISGTIGEVELAGYLRELCRARFQMHGLDPEKGDIRLELNLGSAVADHRRAVCIGLITNEFLTNSLKYAFPEGRGRVEVDLHAAAQGPLVLRLFDNGIGAPEGNQMASSGLGMRLIDSLARQLGADVMREVNPGTRLTVRIRD